MVQRNYLFHAIAAGLEINSSRYTAFSPTGKLARQSMVRQQVQQNLTEHQDEYNVFTIDGAIKNSKT